MFVWESGERHQVLHQKRILVLVEASKQASYIACIYQVEPKWIQMIHVLEDLTHKMEGQPPKKEGS